MKCLKWKLLAILKKTRIRRILIEAQAQRETVLSKLNGKYQTDRVY